MTARQFKLLDSPPNSSTNRSAAFIAVILAIATGGLSALSPITAVIFALTATAVLIVGFILYKPARVLLVFLALLPAYQLTMVLLFYFSNSLTLVKLVQPWKEVLALGAFVAATSFYLFSTRQFRWQPTDRLVVLYLALNLAYLFGPWETTLITRLYGLRADAFFVILYFLGRTIPLSQHRQQQVLAGLLALGALAGIFAQVDRLVLPQDWPARIGLREYLGREAELVTSAPMGLTWTYWTATGLRRASSFFANPLDLAASVHLTGAAALVVALHYPRKSKGRMLALAIFGLILITLLLSVSRAATIIFIVECMLIALLTRRRLTFVTVLAAAIIGLIALVLVSPTMADFIYQTITFTNPSSQGHLQAWLEGAQTILARPLGLGPGTSSHIGSRFGSAIGGENQYVILGVELGLPGLLLYILVQLGGIRAALTLFNRSVGITKKLALVSAIARIGLAMAGLSAHIETYLFQAAISWWLIGFANQAVSITCPLSHPGLMESSPSESRQGANLMHMGK